MYTYVYAHVCIHVYWPCTHTCAYTYVYICIVPKDFGNGHVHAHICIHMCTNVFTKYTHMCVYICKHFYTYVLYQRTLENEVVVRLYSFSSEIMFCTVERILKSQFVTQFPILSNHGCDFWGQNLHLCDFSSENLFWIVECVPWVNAPLKFLYLMITQIPVLHKSLPCSSQWCVLQGVMCDTQWLYNRLWTPNDYRGNYAYTMAMKRTFAKVYQDCIQNKYTVDFWNANEYGDDLKNSRQNLSVEMDRKDYYKTNTNRRKRWLW